MPYKSSPIMVKVQLQLREITHTITVKQELSNAGKHLLKDYKLNKYLNQIKTFNDAIFEIK